MKGYSSEPVIFRRYGRMKCTDTYHLPDFLFTYVMAGSGRVCVGDERHDFLPGSSFLVARHQEALVTLQPDEGEAGCYHTIHIRISASEVEDYFFHNPSPGKPVSRTEGLVQLLPDHPLLHGLSLLLEDGMQQGFRAAYTFTKMKIQECLHILVVLDSRMYSWLSVRNNPQKIDLQVFMEKNFRYNIPLEQLARAAGRSLSTFRRDFVDLFGSTPSRWLMARRLEEARLLLSSGERPGDILIALGFESFSHFTRSYKLRFGVLPSHKDNRICIL